MTCNQNVGSTLMLIIISKSCFITCTGKVHLMFEFHPYPIKIIKLAHLCIYAHPVFFFMECSNILIAKPLTR